MREPAAADWIAAGAGGRARSEALWLAAAGATGFAVSLFGAGLLGLPRPWFVLAHLLVSGTVVAGYFRHAEIGPAALAARPWSGLAGALVAGAVTAGFVLTGPASPSPAGAALVWPALWLGLAYGAIDALLLTVMPVVAAWRMARALGWLERRGGALAAAGLALAASLGVTAAYHLGFPEFRGGALLAPLIGNAVFTLACLASGSALAPLLAHVAMHLAAVAHAWSVSVPLPPHY